MHTNFDNFTTFTNLCKYAFDCTEAQSISTYLKFDKAAPLLDFSGITPNVKLQSYPYKTKIDAVNASLFETIHLLSEVEDSEYLFAYYAKFEPFFKHTGLFNLFKSDLTIIVYFYKMKKLERMLSQFLSRAKTAWYQELLANFPEDSIALIAPEAKGFTSVTAAMMSAVSFVLADKPMSSLQNMCLLDNSTIAELLDVAIAKGCTNIQLISDQYYALLASRSIYTLNKGVCLAIDYSLFYLICTAVTSLIGSSLDLSYLNSISDVLQQGWRLV